MAHHDPRKKRPAQPEQEPVAIRRVGFGSLLTAHVPSEDDSPQVRAALKFRRRALIVAFTALAVFWVLGPERSGPAPQDQGTGTTPAILVEP